MTKPGNYSAGGSKSANQGVSKTNRKSAKIVKRPHTNGPNKYDIQEHAVTLLGSNKSKDFTAFAPVSYMNATVDPTWMRMEGRVTHPELGGGVRVVGRQLMVSVNNTNGSNALFATSLATARDPNSIDITPDAFNGRLALQARTYNRYCFRKLRITYVSRVPTTQAGCFAVGYVSDADTLPASFAATTQMMPCLQASYITPRAGWDVIDDMYSTRTWYTLMDNTSVTTARLTNQGSIVGYPDQPGAASTLMGYFWIDYMIDLYQPTQDEGFTLRLTPAEIEEIKLQRWEDEQEKSRAKEKERDVPRSATPERIYSATSSVSSRRN
jgi:hypothetical protein